MPGPEIQAQTYYPLSDISLTFYSMQITLEKFIIANLFRGDLSRALFASNEFSFRARYEQQDKSTLYDGASSLQLPFFNYWYNSYWEPDDRPAARNTYQALIGLSDGMRKIRSRPVKNTITSTFYFATDYEARVAYDNLRWLFTPRSVILATEVKYKSTIIAVPLIVDLVNTQFNPSFNEKEWLRSNRIIPFTADFEVRSYVLGPIIHDAIPGGIPNTFSQDEIIYLTEEVLLYFLSTKGLLVADGTNGLDVSLALQAYFDPFYDVEINSVNLVSPPTYNSVEIGWDLSIPATADINSVSQIVIKVSGQNPVIIENPNLIGSAVVSGLSELSNYTAHIYFKLKSNKVKAQTLTFTTANNPATPDNIGLKGLSALKGVTF